MGTKHYIGGSGTFGCLYDNHFGPLRSKRDIVTAICEVFEERGLRAHLLETNIHTFVDKRAVGADYVEITACDCDNPCSHLEPGAASCDIAGCKTCGAANA